MARWNRTTNNLTIARLTCHKLKNYNLLTNIYLLFLKRKGDINNNKRHIAGYLSTIITKATNTITMRLVRITMPLVTSNSHILE